MAIPNPDFYFTNNGLVVTFFDLTTNVPISWAWDFADAPTSTSQNPVHTFTAPGIYNVRLTATNADGVKDIVKIISVSEVAGEFGITIEDFVKAQLPMLSSIDPTLLPMLRKKWQLMLMFAPSPAIPLEDVYNESAWPDLYNILIAYLIIYDEILVLAQQSAISGIGSAYNAESGPVVVGSGAQGPVKKIVTGPSEAEWFDAGQYLGNLFRASGGAGTKSVFETIAGQACALASTLGVKIPYCPARKNPNLFVISEPCYFKKSWID